MTSIHSDLNHGVLRKSGLLGILFLVQGYIYISTLGAENDIVSSRHLTSHTSMNIYSTIQIQ